MSERALLALRASKLRKSCGRAAASKFAQKHQVSDLYRLACQLTAAEKAGC